MKNYNKTLHFFFKEQNIIGLEVMNPFVNRNFIAYDNETVPRVYPILIYSGRN